MIDVLFFSRDPGGTNTLVPIYFYLKDSYKLLVYGKDYSIKVWDNAGIQCLDIMECVESIDSNTINDFLSDIAPKVVITGTSFDDKTELLIWEECANLNIFSFAFVDSWMNYSARFSNYSDLRMVEDKSLVKMVYPSQVLCVDNIAKNDMIKEGIPPKKIIVGGYWHLLNAKKKLTSIKEGSVIEYRNHILNDEVGPNSKKLLLFISEPFSLLYQNSKNGFSYGYDEKSIFQYLNNVLKNIHGLEKKYVLVVRPHPKENNELWEKQMLEAGIPMVIDNSTSLECQIRSADLVMGMMSQCLNEAACIGKCIASIQIGRTVDEPLFISKIGIINTILSVQVLKQFIMDFFKGYIKPVKFEPFDNQCEKTVDLIEEVIGNGKISN